MKQFLLDLITNKDGTASTTGFIQFISWLVLSGILIHAYLYDKPFISDWWFAYAGICVLGSPATKGVVSALKKDRTKGDEE
ncbi:TPA: DUF2644 domain-containing protein [Mannheimia haemolytica]|uniref:Protein of uncharacterized function (DUF2644) n=1 Tax=Mannheimia haemolytica TaxID=75985 RepID=A0A378NDQ1_MANHA|nr:DUF2644 domain-containing protein [Mannheimia haemolytica]AGQ39535.1 hypothetical protein J450_10585 [Mannheimia haemolytica D171]KYL17255.1 hypothetical protein AC571_06370 [Mannheimia haemolytica]KYL22306.1 hypothetical protein AC574_08155 [Mannheimia haemolytica]MDW0535587.1 DUF2644 domain-containing protein [Mannheimia haemolytica]MDW0538208.1 DUF2644 domain-containing protein [Mannheimia haemolytica]